jgi:6-pyruvoyltetrahydropterin/6-carboxytetrahydropterin synthase
VRIELDGWKLGLRFSSCHIIPKHDKCGRLHGHTYTIHSKIQGTLNEHGIILDFEIIKNALREVIIELDHKLLVPIKNRQFKIEKGESVRIYLDDKEYQMPKDDVVFLDIESATAESLANYILKQLLSYIEIPKNVTSIELGVDEGWGQGAWVVKRFD